MKPLKLRWLLIWACSFASSVGCVVLAGIGLHAVLSPDDRDTAERLFAASSHFLIFIVLALLAVTGMLAAWLTRMYFAPMLRAAEQTRLVSTTNPAARLDATGSSELRMLIAAVNAFAAAFQRLVQDDAQRIQEAHAALDAERRRLAALVAELTLGVVVCNTEGRILLYNEHARSLFADGAAAGAPFSGGYMGIGRSLYSLMHKESVEHALGQIRVRIAAGTHDPVTTFATSIASGAVLRARIAPISGATAGDRSDGGYVLLLEDLSGELSELAHRDTLLSGLIEQSRGALASVRAATESLASQTDMPEPLRLRFLGVAQDELQRLTLLFERAQREHAARSNRRPDLEPMRAAELTEVVKEKLLAIEGISVAAEPVNASLWIQVDSYGLTLAARYLARRLQQNRSQLALTVSATSADGFVYFDIAWSGAEMAASTVLEWETAPLSSAGEPSERTLRELIAGNRAEFWHEAREGQALFRIMLRSVSAEPSERHLVQRGRPVYYDFDLFKSPERDRALDELPLSTLAYTAFDTETTGLDPSAGDEIVAIGAVRIVNGRLLRDETFDQLIDPKRSIDPEAAKIHGLRASTLAGQPEVGRVLPAFHRFCEDTVLLGHNAAFDLRFLQLKEASTGLRFAHPVLDTLLLSALLFDAPDDHRLETIAERMGVLVIGRHTALGDAMITAEIFLRMLPLLAAQGIVTLRQAREASERTYYAKLRY